MLCIVCCNPGCTKTAIKGPCPVCKQYELEQVFTSYYCSQECFQANYDIHAAIHKRAEPFNDEEWQRFFVNINRARNTRNLQALRDLQDGVLLWEDRSLCRIVVNDAEGFQLFLDNCHRSNTIRLHPQSVTVAIKKDAIACFEKLYMYNHGEVIDRIGEAMGNQPGQGRDMVLTSLINSASKVRAIRIFEFLYNELDSVATEENMKALQRLIADVAAEHNTGIDIMRLLSEECEIDISTDKCIIGTVTHHNLQVLRYIYKQHPNVLFTANHLLHSVDTSKVPNVSNVDCLKFMLSVNQNLSVSPQLLAQAIRHRNYHAVVFILNDLIVVQDQPQCIVRALLDAELSIHVQNNNALEARTGLLNIRMRKILLKLREVFNRLKTTHVIADEKPSTPTIDEHLKRYDAYFNLKKNFIIDLKLPNINSEIASNIASFL